MAQTGSTAEEIVYSLVGLVGENTNEELINLLYTSVYNWRAKLIRQNLQKYGNRTLFEDTIVVPLELASLSADCSIELCNYMRTTVKIPQPVLMEGVQPYKVATTNLGTYMDYIKPEHLLWKKYSKWTSKDLVYTYINGYIYEIGNNFLEKLSITAIWDRPDLLEDYECESCNPTNKVIPANMAADIITAISQNEIRLYLNKYNGEIDETNKEMQR